MFRFLVVFLSLFLVMGNSLCLAKKPPHAGPHPKPPKKEKKHEEYRCSWWNPCCEGAKKDDKKCNEHKYKKWNRSCKRHKGCNCTYDYWYPRRHYDENYWRKYWESEAGKNVRKVNHKINVFRRMVDSTKDFFTW